LETDESIYQVAINNDFSDSRRFILTFQSLYGVTPLQYRKASKKNKKEHKVIDPILSKEPSV
jgi:AraC-like DNA-binding protein